MNFHKATIVNFPNLADYLDKVLMVLCSENLLMKKSKIKFYKIKKMNAIPMMKEVNIIFMVVINN